MCEKRKRVRSGNRTICNPVATATGATNLYVNKQNIRKCLKVTEKVFIGFKLCKTIDFCLSFHSQLSFNFIMYILFKCLNYEAFLNNEFIFLHSYSIFFKFIIYTFSKC